MNQSQNNNPAEIEGFLAEFIDIRNQIQLYKKFVLHFGDLNVAAVLSEIFTWSYFYRKRALPDLPGTGWFWRAYSPSNQNQGQGDTWLERLGLSEDVIRKIVKRLKADGYIETKIKKANGNPTSHYHFVTGKLLELLVTCNLQATKPEKNKERNRQNEGMESSKNKVSLTDTTTECTAKNNDIPPEREGAVVVLPTNNFEKLLELVPPAKRSNRLQVIILNALACHSADIVESNIRYALSHHSPVRKDGRRQTLGGLLCQAIEEDYAKDEREEVIEQATKNAKAYEQQRREEAVKLANDERQRHERLRIQQKLAQEDAIIQEAIRTEGIRRASSIGGKAHVVEAMTIEVAREYFIGSIIFK